jgi:hypothetical protein
LDRFQVRVRFENELRDLGLSASTAVGADRELSPGRSFIPADELEQKYPVSDPTLSKFRSLVYTYQVRRALSQKRTFIDNLPHLARVENVDIHPSAAAPLQELLNAARREIRRQARQITVKAGNAYRSADWQLKTWATARFPQYYRQATNPTVDKKSSRTKPPLIAAGDFSVSAAKKMAAYIAARFASPGFSNHQHGLAVDFHTTERFDGKRKTLTASFAHRELWWKSWLWNWLARERNAYKHGFVPYVKEPWHWEYRRERAELILTQGPGAGERHPSGEREFELGDSASAAPPLRIRFTSRAIPQYKDKNDKIRSTEAAIFVPSALRAAQEISILIFFHGLDSCSPRHNFDPEGVIKSFRLAEQVQNGGRQVALVVPVVHWKKHKRGERRNTGGVWSAANMNAFVEEVLNRIGEHRIRPSLTRLIIAGHSKAYEILTPLAMEFNRKIGETTHGALARLAEVWALDTTYGTPHADALVNWANNAGAARFSVVLYKKEAIQIKNEAIRTPLWYWNRSSLIKSKPRNLVVLRVNEPHCEIPKKHVQNLLSSNP